MKKKHSVIYPYIFIGSMLFGSPSVAFTEDETRALIMASYCALATTAASTIDPDYDGQSFVNEVDKSIRPILLSNPSEAGDIMESSADSFLEKLVPLNSEERENFVINTVMQCIIFFS